MQYQLVKDSRLVPHGHGQYSSVSPPHVDRFSSLPDDLLLRILSQLSTKEAAVTTVVSKKMRQLFSWVTTLDLSDSPISHCRTVKSPHQFHRVHTFKLFVDSVLKASLSPHLTTFKLRFGGDMETRYIDGCNSMKHCEEDCFPRMHPSHLNAWISFPLTRTWIKEIDLCIHIRNCCQLPSQLFTSCHALEVLKLDVSLDLSRVSKLPTFFLPNLKVFQLYATHFNLGALVSRIMSSCPLLEELDVSGWWVLVDYITISSPSLRSLHLCINESDISKLVLTDTPNLQYITYAGYLPSSSSITPMNALVDATISIHMANEDDPVMLSLVRAAHNVQRLALECFSVDTLGHGNLDQLPIFHNLRHLELHRGFNPEWNKLLLQLLHRSPILETLVFPLVGSLGYDSSSAEDSYWKAADLERQYFNTSHEIPCCCRTSLKRIEIVRCWGTECDLMFVRFLLRNASVLVELVLSGCGVNPLSLQRRLTRLPRASSSCSIRIT